MTRFLLRSLVFSFFFLLVSMSAWATHNRAGEIQVEMVADENGDCSQSLTVMVTIITYTRTSSDQADRDTLNLDMGDGNVLAVARSNGPGNPPQGEPQENDIKFNFYITTYTYDGPGQYVISFFDMNRNAGIRNVNFPNSVSVPFYTQTSFALVNPSFTGCNSSPILQVPPIDFACIGEIYTHNPGAFDADGDSLVYELTVPRQDRDDPVPLYRFPNNLEIDRFTGDVTWDVPNEMGEFNIAINIISFRQGQPLDTVVRDMQIIVRDDCENDPPELDIEFEELCVIAGEIIEFDVTATAPLTDLSQQVQLVAYGAPLTLESDNSPATFLPDNTQYQDDPLTKRFRWETTCNHISNQPYNVVFRAVDDFFGDTTGLATLKTVRIKVIGPPPEDVQTEAVDTDIEVSWELPYTCELTDDDYFRGFSVWRRINSDQMPFDTCSPGLDGRGYTLLNPNNPVLDMRNGRYFYLDENLTRGRTYCYRILAVFARRTANGLFFFNSIESLPSNEACEQLGRAVPLLTKVDVTVTDGNNGAIDICWTKPDPEDLDTILNSGPYTYELLRAPGHTENPTNFTSIYTTTAPTFASANDTCYTDINLNTVGEPYTYFLNFYVRGESESLGESTVGGSVYLNATPTDRVNILSWDELVPWENFEYEVFRENDMGALESIATVNDPIYRDEGLENGVEYCYVIRAVGSYNIEGLPEPLLNRSQRLCSIPVDNVPPCPPELTVTNLCDQGGNCDDIAILENTLNWVSPQDICPEFEDVAGYRIYYAPTTDAEFSLIATIDDPNVTDFIHRPDLGIAGCYAITAIDTVMVANESEFSNTVCVDNCPFYELPNAFTPNADSQNDIFIPLRSCFIASVEFKVFNRWGGLVYETSDPALNWNGTNLNGDALAEGTYFYRCEVFENRVEGVLPAPELLSGYIELLRGDNN